MRTLGQPHGVNVLEHARAVMLCPPQRAAVSVANDAAVLDYLTWMRDVRGRAPTTTYNYASLLARFLDEVVGNRPLQDVTVRDVELWVARARQGRPPAPATRARNIAILKSLYKYLTARQYVNHDLGALLVAPTVHNRQPKAVDDEVFRVLWNSPLSGTDRLMVGLGYWFGLRRQEIVALKAFHVQSGQLKGFPRKGGGDDTFPYAEVLNVWETFKPELPVGNEFVESLGVLAVGGEPWQVNKRLARALKTADMDVRAFSPHALRHSFVTNLLRVGMPIEMVSSLSNHSSLTVTLRYVKGGGGRVAEWRQSTLARVKAADWR